MVDAFAHGDDNADSRYRDAHANRDADRAADHRPGARGGRIEYGCDEYTGRLHNAAGSERHTHRVTDG